MRAAVRRLHSPDVDDLREYVPGDPDVFGFLLQIMIGPEDGPGEESFDVYVCTPKWLMAKHGNGDIVEGTHMLIVFRYDYRLLRAFVEDKVRATEGTTWSDLARHLSLFGRWEFHDYTPG
jgi:hypothetical protein